jgi:hypothetical protein
VDEGLARSWVPFLPDGVELPDPELQRIGTVGRRVLRRFVERSRRAD